MTTAWTPTLSLEGERAIRSVNRLAVISRRGRLTIRLATAGLGKDLLADINDLVVVRAFSILESYLSDRGDTLVRRELPVPANPPQIVNYAHRQLLSSFRGNFERGPIRLWKDGLGVDILKDYPNKTDVRDLQELRNLLVHALGYVRAGGLPIPESIRLRVAKLTTSPSSFVGRIPVGDSEVDAVLILVKDFVLWVDTRRP